eukprot:m.515207 g.515207  ORF g.515207 m.515207 type:complete len:68 (-) comp21920_c0_seq1:114-317(-)
MVRQTYGGSCDHMLFSVCHVGRIDTVEIPVASTAHVSELRFNCITAKSERIYLKEFAVYRKTVPWAE